MPHEAEEGSWQTYVEEVWLDSANIVVRQHSITEKRSTAPQKFRVESSLGQADECVGIYELVDDEFWNCQPLWKKQGEPTTQAHWLFSGPDGQWFIGDHHERNAGFHVNTGLIGTLQPHEGDMPHEVLAGGGAWQRFDEASGEWARDRGIIITLDKSK